MSTDPQLSRRHVLDELRGVGRAHSDATVLFHASLAERAGVNLTDWKTLGVLQERGPLRAGDIARETGLTTASVTALIDRLEQRGLVRRRGDPDDRRSVIVEITSDALDVFAPLLESTSRSLARLWQTYTTEELAVIADFLRRNADRLRVETERLAHSDTRRAGKAASSAP